MSAMSADPIPHPPAPPGKKRRRMSTRNRILFLATGWLIVSMPFLFWWNTWFGRQLSDRQLAEYLQDDKKPRHIQHALVQIGERINRHDAAVARWYPEVVRLADYRVEEVRNTDAWVMGQDVSGAGFHQALLNMLNDPSVMVRGNAALSLVRFGDATGRPQIDALLKPATVATPQAGKVTETSTVGTAIHQGGIVATLQANGKTIEVRSPISGRLRNLYVESGQNVAAGAEIANIDAASEQAWEALRALYLVGQPDDLPAILPYEREAPEIADNLRQQALLTDQAIHQRAK
jgi:biotin carboxyl carrier protein